jgi:hypothetical protein
MVGHIVSKNGVATNLEKFDRISKLPFPTTKKALRGFLGMVGYYRRFIHMFAAKTCPLTRFLVKMHLHQWRMRHQDGHSNNSN